jgi:acylphosphatase
MEVSAHIVVKGLVQGVGFRYFVSTRARQFDLNGFVRNLSNGNVEVLAEGDKSAVELFIDEIKIGPRAAHVVDFQIDWGEVQYHYKGFFVE